MDNQELLKLLHQLQDEINHTPTDDPKSAALLRELDDDIQALLARMEEENPEQPESSIVDRLEESLHQFEVTHPQLTMAISRVMESLSNAGI